MGSYSFRWDHPAEEVFVTGTFDNWGKTVKLDKKDVVHEKTVALPPTSDKILYKFVADGEWKHDHTAKSETDDTGNVNNVLYPDDIKPPVSAALPLSAAGPSAPTVEEAVTRPLQHTTPGAFPETPAAEPEETKHDGGILAAAAAGGAAVLGAGAATVASLTSSGNKGDKEDKTFSVNPIPASEGTGNPISLAPGEKVPEPSTINNNTVSSTVYDDPELKESDKETEQAFGIAPIPATGGIGNPVHLEPGEKVPDASTLTGNTVDSTVKLDEASYEKSDAAAPQVAPASAETAKEAPAAALFGLGPQTTNMIPESSMGMGKDAPAPIEGAALSSVAPQSTTAQLAGQQPLEPKDVPEVVTESQKEADAPAEAAANPEAVADKKTMEDELKSKVPEESATSGEKSSSEAVLEAVAGGAAGLGAAAAGAAVYLKEKTAETTGTDPVSALPQSVTSDEVGSSAVASGVPEVVTESQKEANAPAEAAANPEAVADKKALEDELKSKVPEESATSGEKSSSKAVLEAVAGGAAGLGAAAAGTAVYLREKTAETTGTDPVSSLPQSLQDKINGINASSDDAARETTSAVPAEVTESQKEAGVSPEAAAVPEAVHEKSAVEQELLSKVSPTEASGEPAPTETAATSATAPSTSASGAPQLPAGESLAPISMEDNKTGGLNAPADAPAQPAALASGEISPMTTTPAVDTTHQTDPLVTTGVASSSAPAQSGKPIGTPRTGATNSTPQKRNSLFDRIKATPDSTKSSPGDASGSSEKKKKGFFTKIKEKLKN